MFEVIEPLGQTAMKMGGYVESIRASLCYMERRMDDGSVTGGVVARHIAGAQRQMALGVPEDAPILT